MAAEIKVGVGADIKDLEKGLNQATKDVKAFDSQVDKITDNSAKAFDQFSKTAVKANKQVGVSFIGTSRVIQDAAFGPGAIANNLQGISDDFKQLSLQAKESGQSIGKTLVQSLVGGGGLNLALGGLTLGLSLASFGMQAWTRIFGENEKAVVSDKKALEQYTESLEAVTKAQLTGAKDAQDELTTLNVLFHAYQNANLPLKERQNAYKQLQEQYPSYFGNLAFEEKASNKTTEAYNKLSQSILATARARAANDLITKNSSIQLTNEQKIVDEEQKRLGLINEAAKLKNRFDKLEIGASEFAAKQARDLLEAQVKAQAKVAASIKLTNDLKVQNNKLTEENLRLEQFVFKQLEQGANLTGKIGENVKGIEASFKAISALNPLESLGANPLGNKPLAAPGLDTSGLQNAMAGLQPILDESQQRINDWNANIVATIKGGAIQAFAALGESIGSALANGENVFEAAGASLLSSIGDTLIQMGKLTILTGAASTALFNAISNPLNPLSGPAAIAAGVALVGIGAAVKSFAGGIGKGGGASAGGGFTPSVPSGFQASAPTGTRATARMETVVVEGVLRGQDILLSNKRTAALNGRTG